MTFIASLRWLWCSHFHAKHYEFLWGPSLGVAMSIMQGSMRCSKCGRVWR